jgi:predicted esterase
MSGRGRVVHRAVDNRRLVARRPAAILVGAVLVALTGGAPHLPVRADEAAATDATVGPLISGTSSYVEGTYVWTDYAYDDRGPDTNGRPGGDAAYPQGMAPDNVADLIQLQVQPSVGGLVVTAVLQTLTPATRPLVGVAFDSDGDPATGAASLPGSWSPAAPLGMDHLYVLGVDGGRELVFDGGGWEEAASVDVAVDTERNTLAAEVPFAVPAAGTLRAVGVVGYEHDGRSWLTGGAPVHDLAFVDDGWLTVPYLRGVTDAVSGFVTGDGAYWQDGQQAAILAGDADPGPAIAGIDVVTLRSGATELAAATTKGFHTFLYHSTLRLGEGIQGSGNSALYAGPYQPYLVWLPERPRPGLSLVLYLHGASQTHISTVNTAHYDPETRDPVIGRPDAFFDFDAVVAWPLGRGPQQWYEGASEQDVLDVADDVVARLSLDADRVMLAGLSMGGFGTFRLAQLYPDRWSIAYADVGADRTNLAENLTALPVRLQNGAADYLVHVNQAIETRNRLEAAGTVDYRSWILHQGHHQPAVRMAECVYQGSFGRTRVKDPAQVRYTVDPAMFVDDPETGLSLRYEGAYWVSGMQPAGSDRGSVDLTSLAFGYAPVPAPTSRVVHENVTAGRDFCGPDPEATTGDSWDEQARAVEQVAQPARAVVRGTLTGLSAVAVAADRAGIAIGSLELGTDHHVALTLTGLAPGTAVTVVDPGTGTSGGRAVRAGDDGTATVAFAAGSHLLTVARGR